MQACADGSRRSVADVVAVFHHIEGHCEHDLIVDAESERPGAGDTAPVGDVAGAPWLAHKASHEAITCVEHIAGELNSQPRSSEKIPGCIYCRPQVASVGLTEELARKRGFKTRIGRFGLQANGKALAIKEPEGLVKTVFDADTGKLLGAHMIGPEVTEQIQGLVIAMGAQLSNQQLAEMIFPHPTVSESIHESVLDSLNKAIHQ